MTAVMTLAKYIVQISSPELTSNLKLQKLLYYAQGWHLGIYEKPIFHAEIQAWQHGPVVPDVFHALRHLRWNPVPIPSKAVNIEPQYEKHIRNVLQAYGTFSAEQLERLSHTEKPWLDARGDIPLSAPSQAPITHKSMKEYFGSRVNAKQT